MYKSRYYSCVVFFVFFKQKTAYEIRLSLVGSEMCIRDRCIGFVASEDRAVLGDLLGLTESVDLVIPRGGEKLKQFLVEKAKVPVIYAAGGNCHVYVDAGADLDQAVKIAVNAKVDRPGVCNSAETLLVHSSVAQDFLPLVV